MKESTTDALLPKIVWPDVRASLRSRLLDRLILLTGRKKWWASAAVVQERARKLALRPAPHHPVRLARNIKTDLRFAEGWPVYHIEATRSAGALHHVVFLHGGAYVHEIVATHWSFVSHLANETNAHCVVPIYPLAPRGTAKEVVPATGRILRDLIETVGQQNVTVVGNSAGGGLSLAAAQWLRDAGHPQPNSLILICPGVDGALTQCTPADPAHDVMQDVPGMLEAFRMYAGGLNVAHPFVSPSNAQLDGLAPMLMFTGTHDLYHPDIVAFANKAAAAGVPVEMHVRNGLPHNYPLLPTPEGREARAIIARAVAGLTNPAGPEVAGTAKAKHLAKSLFSRRAAQYEATFAGRHSARMKKAALACLVEPLQGAVLDVGCGPGILLQTLAASYPELKLAGLDIAPEMIRIATERLGKRAEIKLGDAESLPWQDAAFDYIFCVDSFHHYPNPRRALSEFHRVLKPDGKVVLADPTAPLPFRSVMNCLVRFLRLGDMRIYDKEELTTLFDSCRFQPLHWRTAGSWGFVASARSVVR